MNNKQIRVRFYPSNSDETFDGTVIEEKPNYYVVIPDQNLALTQNWNKKYCKLLNNTQGYKMKTLKNIYHNSSFAGEYEPFIETKIEPTTVRGLFLYRMKKNLVYIVNTSDYIIGVCPSLSYAQERIIADRFDYGFIDNRIGHFQREFEKQETKTINVTKELLEEVEEE